MEALIGLAVVLLFLVLLWLTLKLPTFEWAKGLWGPRALRDAQDNELQGEAPQFRFNPYEEAAIQRARVALKQP